MQKIKSLNIIIITIGIMAMLFTGCGEEKKEEFDVKKKELLGL